MDNFFAQLSGDGGCFGNQTGGCGWKEVAFLFNDILKSLIVVGLFAAACMVAYAGFLLLKGQGNPAARTRARRVFKGIVLGVILLFGAYYVVDLFLNQLGVAPEFRNGFVEPSNTNTQ
ncbi:MAG: hypothetical protein RJB39_415 [Candidatus Parcubacteria bacterium]|jgi:Mn2+/Fe2+ NRAMP family transporter